MGHLRVVLDALSRARGVVKISVGPQSRMLAYDGTYAMEVTKRAGAISTLKKLDLNECRLGPDGAITVSAFLATNATLTHVILNDNEIGDDGAVAMSHMIRRNGTLQELILDNNDISPYGQRALRDAIYDTSSFAALEGRSNHVLQSYFYNPRSVFGPGVMNDILSSHAANLRSKTPKNAVTKKLKRVLQKKYGVRLHFETFLGAETGVLPRVLGWISTKCDLDLMYAFKPILMTLLEGRA